MREAQALALVVDTPCAYVLQSGKAETNSYLAVLSMHFTSPFYAFLDDRTHVISDIYKYKTDYNVGDIVTVENEYRITAETRIIEMIESWSADKMYTAIPTFENWEVTA